MLLLSIHVAEFGELVSDSATSELRWSKGIVGGRPHDWAQWFGKYNISIPW